MNVTQVSVYYAPDGTTVDTQTPLADMEVVDILGFQHEDRAADDPRNIRTIAWYYTRKVDDSDRCIQLGVRTIAPGDCIVINDAPHYLTQEDLDSGKPVKVVFINEGIVNGESVGPAFVVTADDLVQTHGRSLDQIKRVTLAKAATLAAELHVPLEEM